MGVQGLIGDLLAQEAMGFHAAGWMPQQSTLMREHLVRDRLRHIPDGIRIQRLLENSIAPPLILRIADLFSS